MDLISNSLTAIRNANLNKNKSVILPAVQKIVQLVEVLKKEGLIESYTCIDPKKIIVYLKYIGTSRKPIITNLRRISTPGRRVYVNNKDIPQLLGGLGIILLSTSKGILTNKQAKKLKIGGELLCSIW